MKYVCQKCGDTVNAEPGYDPWDCVACAGGKVLPVDRSEVTANEELRELVKEWREKGADLELNDPDRVAERGRGMIECADELEELLNE